MKCIAQITPVPLLILHGLDDPVVPTKHGRMLFEAAREPKQLWLTDTPGHIQFFAGKNVREQLLWYLDQALTAASKQR